jgi:hypothetical protein
MASREREPLLGTCVSVPLDTALLRRAGDRHTSFTVVDGTADSGAADEREPRL